MDSINIIAISLLLLGAALFYGIWAWAQVRRKETEVAERRLDLEFAQLTLAREQHEQMMKIHAEQRRFAAGMSPMLRNQGGVQ